MVNENTIATASEIRRMKLLHDRDRERAARRAANMKSRTLSAPTTAYDVRLRVRVHLDKLPDADALYQAVEKAVEEVVGVKKVDVRRVCPTEIETSRGTPTESLSQSRKDAKAGA